MSNLKLSIAMGDYDRTRPIVDGRVKIDGVDPTCMLLSPEEMFFRAFRYHEYDVSELSISSYCVSVANGSPHYIAMPVFLSRAFRHTSIYIRTDRGIKKPVGRKNSIGVVRLPIGTHDATRPGQLLITAKSRPKSDCRTPYLWAFLACFREYIGRLMFIFQCTTNYLHRFDCLASNQVVDKRIFLTKIPF